jgi:hypothetical protein
MSCQLMIFRLPALERGLGVSAVRFTSDFKRLLAVGRPASLLMTETVRLLTERSQARSATLAYFQNSESSRNGDRKNSRIAIGSIL